MKGIKGLLVAAVLGLAVFASDAVAQSWGKWDGSGNYATNGANLTSATAVSVGKVRDTTSDLVIAVSGTAAITATIQPVTPDGVPIGPSITTSVDTTQRVVSFTAPLMFAGVKISPTVPLTGTQNVSTKMVSTKR